MANPNYYGLILAGGRGTRFWPRSRKTTPKQLLPFHGSMSLLQETVARLAPLVPPERIWVLTNDILAAAIRRQLPDVPRHQVIAEPVDHPDQQEASNDSTDRTRSSVRGPRSERRWPQGLAALRTGCGLIRD